MRVGGSYPEMGQQEKVLDGYIELLKTDQVRGYEVCETNFSVTLNYNGIFELFSWTRT